MPRNIPKYVCLFACGKTHPGSARYSSPPSVCSLCNLPSPSHPGSCWLYPFIFTVHDDCVQTPMDCYTLLFLQWPLELFFLSLIIQLLYDNFSRIMCLQYQQLMTKVHIILVWIQGILICFMNSA